MFFSDDLFNDYFLYLSILFKVYNSNVKFVKKCLLNTSLSGNNILSSQRNKSKQSLPNSTKIKCQPHIEEFFCKIITFCKSKGTSVK